MRSDPNCKSGNGCLATQEEPDWLLEEVQALRELTYNTHGLLNALNTHHPVRPAVARRSTVSASNSTKSVPYITINKTYKQQFCYINRWNSSYEVCVTMLVNIYDSPNQ